MKKRTSSLFDYPFRGILDRITQTTKALTANKWWIIASLFTSWNLVVTLLGSGAIRIKVGTIQYVYFFGETSATAGLLAGIVLAVTFSKLKEFGTHRTIVIEAVPGEPEGSF